MIAKLLELVLDRLLNLFLLVAECLDYSIGNVAELLDLELAKFRQFLHDVKVVRSQH